MGVHGLSSFLRENKRSIAEQLTFGVQFNSFKPIIVDGWSLIYHLYIRHNTQWIYGGDYAKFSELIVKLVESWSAVGVKLFFVFDGPHPEAKFSTLVSRLTQAQVHHALLFFRTSRGSRSDPRFLRETFILPPLAYNACVQTLQDYSEDHPGSLELHYADGEGDLYAVELAGRLGGYIAAQDSDFVVLHQPNYAGYIPLDEIAWRVETAQSPVNEDDGFQVVQKGKRSKGKAPNKAQPPLPDERRSGLLPPESVSAGGDVELVFSVYTPERVAQHLNLPLAVLPLIGGLVGNDFTSSSLSDPLFERRLSPVQRISHVSQALRTILHPQASSKNKKRKPPESVLELIELTINHLLDSGRGASSVDVGKIVDGVVDATLPYAIPKQPNVPPSFWPSHLCALHDPLYCPLLLRLWRDNETNLPQNSGQSELQNRVRELYVQAYRQGKLLPDILDILDTQTCWPRAFTENPDLESVSRSVGGPIRVLIYALLDHGVGLIPEEPETMVQEEPIEEPPESADENAEDDLDDNEVIDVEENHSEDEEEYLQLRLSATSRSPSRVNGKSNDLVGGSHPGSRLTTVTEYIRKGTRIVAEKIEVDHLTAFTVNGKALLRDSVDLQTDMIQLSTPEVRLDIFLDFLQANTPAIQALDSRWLIPVLALCWVVRRMHTRFSEHDSKQRDAERWTEREARAFLAAFSFDAEPQHPENAAQSQSQLEVNLGSSSGASDNPSDPAPITDRNVQVTAQVLMALESVEWLSQVLLLTEYFPPCARYFSGDTFHMHLSTIQSQDLSGLLSTAWQSAEECLVGCFRTERSTSKKKKEKSHDVSSRNTSSSHPKGPQNIYSILDDVSL